jgi:hypothetical protein
LNITEISEAAYAVSGNIIEISSAEMGTEKAALTRSILLSVIKDGADWKINDVNLGKHIAGDGRRVAYTVNTAIITDNQEGLISADGGQTWTDGEAYQKLYPTPDIVWWTYDEYKEWLDGQKKILPDVIGETGGYYDEKNVLHEEVWTQEKVDEAIAMYEQTLEYIRNGARISKPVYGDDGEATGFSLNPSDPPSVEYRAGLSFGNGGAIDLGSFATAEQRLAAVKAFCDEQVKEGNMTQQEADGILDGFK